MEFCDPSPFCRLAFDMFQFPTGWNSTQYKELLQDSVHVSIPNGMEFYLVDICASYDKK